jgi:DNA-binding transcriptional MerR regulator
MFRIGDFSRLTQVTVKALRHYDDLGLLRPAQVDRENGYRYYSGAQVARLNRILALKELGLTLDQIGPLLDADLSPAQLRAMLQVKQAETADRIEQERARLARIEAWLREVGNASAQSNVIVKRIEAQRVASVRQVLPHRRDIGQLFRALAMYRQRHDLNAASWTVVWHDPDFRETDVDAEATFTTSDPLPSDDRIRPGELPLVETMACVVHHGSTELIGTACRTLLQFVDGNDYKVAGPERVRMIERRDPASPDNVLELQLPIARGEVP